VLQLVDRSNNFVLISACGAASPRIVDLGRLLRAETFKTPGVGHPPVLGHVDRAAEFLVLGDERGILACAQPRRLPLIAPIVSSLDAHHPEHVQLLDLVDAFMPRVRPRRSTSAARFIASATATRANPLRTGE
jgi:hypothetical protein